MIDTFRTRLDAAWENWNQCDPDAEEACWREVQMRWAQYDAYIADAKKAYAPLIDEIVANFA